MWNQPVLWLNPYRPPTAAAAGWAGPERAATIRFRQASLSGAFGDYDWMGLNGTSNLNLTGADGFYWR